MVGKQEYEIAIVSKYKEANTLLDDLLVYFKEEIEKKGGLFL